MQYIVIEYFGQPTIVSDETGEVKMFNDYTDATDEARECQNGIVVPLSSKLMGALAEAANYIEEQVNEPQELDFLHDLNELLGDD